MSFLIYLVQKYAEIPVAARHFFEEFHTMYQFAQKHYISESTAHRKSMNGNSNCKLTEFGCNEVAYRLEEETFDYLL